MDNCLFCKIINGQLPSDKVYEDDYVYAFKDINPISPVHVLIIPKEHISSANEIDDTNVVAVAHIFKAAKKIAKQFGIDSDGYRIVNNCGEKAGQTVFHLHFHLIGGRELNWPAG